MTTVDIIKAYAHVSTTKSIYDTANKVMKAINKITDKQTRNELMKVNDEMYFTMISASRHIQMVNADYDYEVCDD